MQTLMHDQPQPVCDCIGDNKANRRGADYQDRPQQAVRKGPGLGRDVSRRRAAERDECGQGESWCGAHDMMKHAGATASPSICLVKNTELSQP